VSNSSWQQVVGTERLRDVYERFVTFLCVMQYVISMDQLLFWFDFGTALPSSQKTQFWFKKIKI